MARVATPTRPHDGGMSDTKRDVRSTAAAFASMTEPWQPHRLATVNDADVKVVRLLGEFVWHTHPDTDELFLVRSGTLVIQLRDGDVTLEPGDVYVIPAGVEHCPLARDEVEAILIERVGTPNTGDAGGDRTTVLREL